MAIYSTLTVEDMERVIYSPGLKRATEKNDFKQVRFEEKWGYVKKTVYLLMQFS